MSRKDYVEAARIIREADYLTSEARARLVSDLVTFFSDENARFSPSRFRQACEPVPRCTTCGRPADDGYVNERAGERCVDAVHDPYSPASAAVRRALAAWARTSSQLELVELHS